MFNENEYLTTGEFAKVFEIKKDTLFFYDKKGIFSPAYTDDNGYRYYHISQLIEFRTIDILKDSGLSLSDIKEYLDQKSPQRFVELANFQIDELEKQKKRIDANIYQLAQTTKQIQFGLGSYYDSPFITSMPEENYLYFPLNTTPEESPKWKVLVAEVLVYCKKHNLLADFLRGSILRKENIESGNFIKDTSIIRIANTIEADNLITKPAGLYGVIIYKGNYNKIHEGYTRLLDFIHENVFEIVGDAYELELVGYLLTERRDEFIVQIAIPIAPISQ